MITHMTSDDMLAGGDIAGGYLQSLGKTDLAKLTGDEWRTFCVLLVNGANEACGKRMVGAWTVPIGGEG